MRHSHADETIETFQTGDNLQMKTATITLYGFKELTPKAKERALSDYQQYLSDSGEFSERITELIEYQLEEAGLEELKPAWSLNYCQGDGVAFYGKIDAEKLAGKDADFKILLAEHDALAEESTLDIEVENIGHGRYHHWNTMRTSASLNAEESAALTDLLNRIEGYVNRKLVQLSRECETKGYAAIESMTSEEEYAEVCDMNDYTFEANGEMRNA